MMGGKRHNLEGGRRAGAERRGRVIFSGGGPSSPPLLNLFFTKQGRLFLDCLPPGYPSLRCVSLPPHLFCFCTSSTPPPPPPSLCSLCVWGLSNMVPPNVATIMAAGVAALTLRFVSKRKAKSDHGERVEDEELEDGESPTVGVVPVTVAWDRIECILRDKRGNVIKRLLQGVSGEAKAGKLLAIMGPSGSGKTTLLNVLAGQLAASPRLRLTGSLSINGRPFSKSKHRVAYVRQEDLFFSQLTVRETLALAAELQLPKTWKPNARERYVQELLYRLGLVSCADTIVGDAKVRGISGGEKKRLSIACELIASPSIIFADEPTTGLDAFQAERVMETLRKLAEEGHTVVCSIHQPRGSIYSKFDDLILLSSGAVVYAGPAADHALKYFADLGHKCPEHTNPAEYFADLISIDYSSSDNEIAARKKVADLVEAFASKQKKIGRDNPLTALDLLMDPDDEKFIHDTVVSNRSGFLWQFQMLLRRAWRQTTRDKSTNRVRGTMSITSALIFGSIFWRMGRSQTSIQDRMGLLQVAAINTAMSALTKTVNVFPKERAIVQREQAKGSYSLAPYLIAKLVAEAPVSAAFPLMFGAVVYPMTRLNPSLQRFLTFSGVMTVEAFAASAMGLTVGAIAPTTEAALALGPSLMTVFIVFGGYYVNSDNTPTIFRWIPKVSLIRWAFQALSINEFKGLTFDVKNSFDLQDGDQVLERLSFGGKNVQNAVNQELRIALFWYWLTYVLLKRNKAKFQVLEAPSKVTPHELAVEDV
ncbi:ABC transporter G family member 7 [Physcomitrium patens]|uniref:ABC transporter domain-containing protein n=2 Tax=Physcomitrium patens TaxID=3218 RepID=A0A7I4ANB0_PHYPA|nr:ABC transporter G family member 7-like [Physcomitrium patens]|eukprot:XP_024394887.1 ABC transporter G family member 7-like [Physcomitrella patens]